MTKHDHKLCRGCGGRITPHDDAFEITTGRLLDDEDDLDNFDPKDTWGYMHRQCFLVAVGDPAAIFSLEPATIS